MNSLRYLGVTLVLYSVQEGKYIKPIDCKGFIIFIESHLVVGIRDLHAPNPFGFRLLKNRRPFLFHCLIVAFAINSSYQWRL